MNTTPSNEESMKIIMEKTTAVANDILKLIDDQLRDLGVDDTEMCIALKFSIVQKMAQNTEIPASLKE